MMNPHPPPSSSPPNRHPHSNFEFNPNPPHLHAGSLPHQRGRSEIEARRIRRAKIEETLTIAVSSLRQAMWVVLKVPHGRRDIVVHTVRVDHALAMRELCMSRLPGESGGRGTRTGSGSSPSPTGSSPSWGVPCSSFRSIGPPTGPSSRCSAVAPTALRGAPARWWDLPAARGASLRRHPPSRQ